MYLLLCYDVVTSSRRGKLRRRLEGWLQPVQKSVFEGEIESRRLPELLSMVRGVMDHETDTVRIYLLCGGCRRSTLLLGVAHRCSSDEAPVVV